MTTTSLFIQPAVRPAPPPATPRPTPPPTPPAAVPAGEPELLAAYLAEHETDCPGCGYNLHAGSGDRCPECGRGLALGLVVERSTLWRRTGLLVLILTWLVLAGAMNATRAGRTIHTIATARQSVQIVAQRLDRTSPRVSLILPGDGSGNVIPTDLLTEETVLNYTITAPGQPTVRSPGNIFASAGAPNWSAVRWNLWASFAAWGVLAVAAISGLAMVLAARRRPGSRRLSTAIMTIAWVGFASYFAFHGYSFAAEFF